MTTLHPQYEDSQLQAIGVLALAHVGDAVYDLLVRAALCMNGVPTAAKLHVETTRRVCATAQAEAARTLLPALTEAERAVFQRGRNAKTHQPPKQAEREDYMLATALESLFGHLYLTGQESRLRELMDLIFPLTV